MKSLRALLASALLLAAPTPALAVIHFGPQAGYQIYHRFAPEETPSVRTAILLSLKTDFGEFGQHFLAEFGASYETGLDQFATQDTVNDRIIRVRAGGIYKPFTTEVPLFGLRLGVQYNVVSGVLNFYLPPSTSNLTPRNWSPYFGAVLGVFPDTGFGVEDELTVWYDQYFKCLVYQISFGVDVF